MSEEEKKAIEQFKEINLEDCSCEKCLYQEIEECHGCPTMIKETILNLIEKQYRKIEKVRDYIQQEICLCEHGIWLCEHDIEACTGNVEDVRKIFVDRKERYEKVQDKLLGE